MNVTLCRKAIYRNEEVIPVIITFPSEGDPQQTTCLPIDMINGWLFTINTNRVSEEIRPVVLYYQKECYRALFEFWNKTKNVEPPKPVEPPPQAGSFEDKFIPKLKEILCLD